MSNEAIMAALALMQGRGDALGALQPAYDKARGVLTGNDYYKQFYDTGGQANAMLANAMGLNGAGGREAAMSSFYTDPGYQFRLGQGEQALNRNAASRGMLASGNNTADILKYSQGLASQEYGNWFNRLNAMTDRGMTAAGGMQAKQGSLSALDYGYGADQAGIHTGTARALAEVSMKDKEQKQDNVLSAILGGVNLGARFLGGGGVGALTSLFK